MVRLAGERPVRVWLAFLRESPHCKDPGPMQRVQGTALGTATPPPLFPCTTAGVGGDPGFVGVHVRSPSSLGDLCLLGSLRMILACSLPRFRMPMYDGNQGEGGERGRQKGVEFAASVLRPLRPQPGEPLRGGETNSGQTDRQGGGGFPKTPG